MPPYVNPAMRSLKALAGPLNQLRRAQLWLQVVVGMVLGIMTGLVLGPDGGWIDPATGELIGEWLALPGEVFLTLIQMVVLGLVLSSVILGINASEDRTALRRIGALVLPFFFITTVIACLIGVGVTNFTKPGLRVDPDLVERMLAGAGPVTETAPPQELSLTDIPDRIVSIIPRNVIDAAVKQDMLQIVVFAVFAGLAVFAIPPARARPFLDLMASIQEISLKVVAWAMYLAPVAVFGLLARLTIQIGSDAITGMAAYVGTVLLGLALLMALYLLLVAVLGRRNPLLFLRQIREVMLLAFSTSSSAAVMPLSVKVAEEQMGVPRAVAQFVVPIGTMLNMAGTALYQVTATIFLTQVYGVDLSAGALAMLISTAVGASIGTPASPGVGIVILATLLTGVGVPASGIALIIGVDRILDMSRTTVNVTGDLVTCVIVDRWLARPPETATAPA